MREIQHFNYNGHTIRIIERNREAWFLAKDVCEVLNLKTDNVREILEPDEVREINPKDYVVADTGLIGQKFRCVIPEANGPNLLIVNEPGLYTMAARSRKKTAKAFKRWVTTEVLPSIREAVNDTAARALDDAFAMINQSHAIMCGTIERLIDHGNALQSKELD